MTAKSFNLQYISIVWLEWVCVEAHGEINILNLMLSLIFFFFKWSLTHHFVILFIFSLFNWWNRQQLFKITTRSQIRAVSIYLLEQRSYHRHTSYNVTGLACDKAIEQIDNHLDQSKWIKRTIKIKIKQTNQAKHIVSLLVACGVCIYLFYDRQANCVSRPRRVCLRVNIPFKLPIFSVNIWGYDGQ